MSRPQIVQQMYRFGRRGATRSVWAGQQAGLSKPAVLGCGASALIRRPYLVALAWRGASGETGVLEESKQLNKEHS